MAAPEVISAIRVTGGEYPDLSSWQAGEVRDLVVANEIAVAELYDDWAGHGLLDRLVVSGWTDDADRYPLVRAAAGHEPKGRPGVGARFYWATNWESTYVSDGYSRLEHVGVNRTAAGYAVAVGRTNVQPHSHVVSDCAGVASADAFAWQRSVFHNCVAFRAANGFTMPSYYDHRMYNCAAINCGTGFKNSGATSALEGAHIVNCFAYGCTTSYASTSCYTADSYNNAASDGDVNPPPGNSPLLVAIDASDFVDAANDDFHLSATSRLKSAGVNLYDYPGLNSWAAGLVEDVDGDPWPASGAGAWDIGFDALVASSPSAVEGVLAGVMPLTQSAGGGSPVAAAQAATPLPSMSALAGGSVVAQGSLSAAVTALASELFGAPVVGGAAGSSLPAMRSQLTSSSTLEGSAASAIPALVSSLAAAPVASGVVLAVLPSLRSSAAGTVVLVATAQPTLPPMASSVQGESDVLGALASALPAMRSALIGDGATTSGAIDTALPALGSAALGVPVVSSFGQDSLPPMTSSLSGAMVAQAVAEGTLPLLVGSLSGAPAAVAAASSQLPAFQASLYATQGSEVTGEVSAPLPALVSSALGSAIGEGITIQLTGVYSDSIVLSETSETILVADEVEEIVVAEG